MSNPTANILRKLSKKLGISSSELSDFLFIDRKTLYNYKNFTDNVVPEKVKNKIIEYFSSNYGKDLDNLENIHEFLDTMPENLKNDIYRKFVLTTQIRHGNAPVLLSEGDFKNISKILHVSETYSKLLIELLSKKLKSGNDYGLLEYIDNYHN